MTSVRILWALLSLLWIGAEIILARKTRVDNSRLSDREDRSQALLWTTVAACMVSALIFKAFQWMPIPIEYLLRQLIALLLFAAGLSIRYCAVGRLGRFFTTNVSIQREHELIVDGPYRWVRHPAYSGLLIALTATGLAMGDWLALLVLVIPTVFAVNFRIAIEEKLLAKKFGIGFREYSQKTWKLVPWLF